MKIGVYKLKNGNFQVSHKELAGNRVRKRFSSYREVVAYTRKVQIISAEPVLLVSPKTIAELAQDYIEMNPESNLRKRSGILFDSFINYFGTLHCHELNKAICSHWIEYVKTEMNYSSRTLRVCKYTYSRFFEDLCHQRLIEKNYLGEVYIKMGTRVRHRVFLSESELMEILEGLKQLGPTGTYPVCYFQLHTGCKAREALRLQWSDLNLEKGTVNFPRTLNANARSVNLSPLILNYLRSYPQIYDHVFLNENGEAWQQRAFYKCIVEDRNAIGLERHWDSFSFRHSFAYHFLKSGKTLQQLQLVIGHRQIGQTIQTYGDIV